MLRPCLIYPAVVSSLWLRTFRMSQNPKIAVTYLRGDPSHVMPAVPRQGWQREEEEEDDEEGEDAEDEDEDEEDEEEGEEEDEEEEPGL